MDSNGKDAVAFTAGPKGAIFGLGVIHAYLAADRKPPQVVAGVSAGALSAAALQRCYKELEDARRSNATREQIETARWRWFRRYLSFLVENPLEVFWRVLPDISDLLTDRPPIRQTALPKDQSGQVLKGWDEREEKCRLEYYLVVKLLEWFSHVRVRVSTLAKAAISWVRFSERYPDRPVWKISRWFSFLFLVGRGIFVGLSMSWTIVRHPGIYWPWAFELPGSKRWKYLLPRPLFGMAWVMLGPLVLASAAGAGLWALGIAANWQMHSQWLADRANLAGNLSLLLIVVCLAWIYKQTGTWSPGVTDLLVAVPSVVLQHARLRDSFLHVFFLQLKLHELFRNADGSSAKLTKDPMPALLVATPLETLMTASGGVVKDAQVATRSRGGYDTVEALTACLALPGLFRPVTIQEKDELEEWLEGQRPWAAPSQKNGQRQKVHLVDGATVCPNPLPALFGRLKRWFEGPDSADRDRTQNLFSTGFGDYRVHLVHSTPLRKAGPPGCAPDLSRDGEIEPLPNCVDSGVNGLRLSGRRDSQMEVWQINYQSELALELAKARCMTPGELASLSPRNPESKKRSVTLPILVDQIAPEADLEVPTPLNPNESVLLRHAASGCRATLETLFRAELARIGEDSISCPALLSRLVPRLNGSSLQAFPTPGLPEMCSHCTQRIGITEAEGQMARGAAYTAMARERYLKPEFLKTPAAILPKSLCRLPLSPEGPYRSKPRIVFLASGGVFRGAFHIGMLGALWQLKIQPDLIVGASVGTLMGAVLGQLPEQGAKLLGALVDTFENVDERVALTHQLKSAMRDLAARGSTVHISPAQIRRKVLSASRDDVGIAATGAPAELIDAISRLFLIPHDQTRRIASDFVSEDVTRAIGEFVRSLRDETVVRLGVRDAILGTELMEKELDLLLCGVRNRAEAQPFYAGGTGFLATTVNLVTESMEILGIDPAKQQISYDFAQAALSSSAFPLAFAPRRESQVYPGNGRRDVFYGDGGMYDNLPFLPAMMAMGAAQRTVLAGESPQRRWEALQDRFEQPDLFLVGALDVNPDPGEQYTPSIVAIRRRASSLAKNIKTLRFQRLAERTDKSLRKMILDTPAHTAVGVSDTLDSFVLGAVLAAAPVNPEHLNPTFAFCRSVGLKQKRLRRSMADGCFELLLQIRQAQQKPEDLTGRALRALDDRIPPVTSPGVRCEGQCPHYQSGGVALACPFFEAGKPEIWRECARDPDHRASA